MNPIEFLVDDWKKIPQNLRYFFLAGAFLIFNSWLVDHWGTADIYLLWGLDIRYVGYSLGLSIILLGFLLLTTKQFIFLGRVVILRKKYPINELGSKFHLVWFQGKLILFDMKKKKFHHVYPLETAEDLFFAGTGIHKNINFEQADLHRIELSSTHNIDVSTFTDGGSINTQN